MASYPSFDVSETAMDTEFLLALPSTMNTDSFAFFDYWCSSVYRSEESDFQTIPTPPSSGSTPAIGNTRVPVIR